MTENKKPVFNPFKTDMRRLIRILVARMLKGPYLPKNMAIFYILSLLTFNGLMLASQPLGYWQDPSLGTNDFMKLGALSVVGLNFLWLIVGLLGLSLINYRITLVAWLCVSVDLLRSIGAWLESCRVGRWLPFTTTCANTADYVMLIGTIIIGILLLKNYRIPLRADTTIDATVPAPRPIWQKLAIPIIWMILVTTGVIWSAWTPSTGWLPINIAADKLPSPRSDGEIVYDTKRQRAVMFGGSTAWLGNDYEFTRETWEWDGQAWTKMSPENIPPERVNFGMAYDEKRGVSVLFGGLSTHGTVLSDTWEWDGKNWHKLCTCSGPQARGWHEMIYDPQRGKVILYGGTDNNGKFFNDAWEWNGSVWAKMAIEDSSPTASGFVLNYDPARQQIWGLLSGYPGGTWIWQDAHWRKLSPKKDPGNRTGSGVVYEPDRKLAFLYGGWLIDRAVNDTWIFDGKEWDEYQSPLHPPALSHPMMFYDPVRKHIVLFGGYGKSIKYSNEMWELVLPYPVLQK